MKTLQPSSDRDPPAAGGSDGHRPAIVLRAQNLEGLPVLAARVWLHGGSRVEDIPGQAYLTGRLLVEGTRRRSWEEIAADGDQRGIAIHSVGAAESLVVSIDALAEDEDLVLSWLAEMLLEPVFPEDRFEWIRDQASTELEIFGSQAETKTGQAFLEQLYAPHPYCRLPQGNPDSLARLTPEDCAAFHQKTVGWGGCIAICGAIDEQKAARRFEQLFGDLARPGSRVALPPVEPPRGTQEARREISLPYAEQAILCAGHLTVARNHPQWTALQVAGAVLGSGTGVSGRLPSRIRERESLAYSVVTTTVGGAGLDAGRVVAYVGTSPAKVPRAVRAVREEIRRLVEDGIDETEFEEARSYLIGRDAFRRETARKQAGVLAESEFYGLHSDRSEWVVEQLNSLSRTDVEEAVRRWIHPDEIRETLGLPAGV